MEESIEEREPEVEQAAEEKPVPVAATTPSVALCLSGGGYRAALFHLGVMRCLHEMGILQTVTKISSVSGGSIISSYVAKRMVEEGMDGHLHFADWERDLSNGFRTFAKRDVRTGPILLHLLWNWLWPTPRARHLQWNYNRKLLRQQNLAASSLIFHFNLEQAYYFCHYTPYPHQTRQLNNRIHHEVSLRLGTRY
jgi:predicted acylesterase/phospholipase RssA